MINNISECLISIDRDLKEREKVLEKAGDSLKLSLAWLEYFLKYYDDRDIKILVEGANSAAIESFTLFAFGFLRPSALSLRLYYELFHQFLYYKDHNLEWTAARDFRAQAKLPKEVRNTFVNFHATFDKRMNRLLKKRRRINENPYNVLSPIAHGSAYATLTAVSQPVDIVCQTSKLEDCVFIFSEVDEYLSDICASSFDANILSLPIAVRDDLDERLEGKAASVLEM